MMVKRMISLLLSLVLLAGMTAVVPTVGAAETQSEQTVAERHRAHDLRQRQNEGL